jgi:hypothetical protein
MTTATQTNLATQNEAWGFFGTLETNGHNAKEAWQIASAELQNAIGEPFDPETAEGIRAFLDSRLGRHFADMVHDNIMRSLGSKQTPSLRAAITDAIQTHNAWTISRRDSRDHGIPAGLPYLTGWILHFTIETQNN